MSVIAALYAELRVREEIAPWQDALWAIAHEVGVDLADESPEAVVRAVQGLRDALNRAKGYSGTPLTPDGQSVPFREAGR